MKVPLLLFSGGLDSTYLVSYMLAENGPVDILYVNGGQAPEKMRLELEARQRNIQFWSARLLQVELRNAHEQPGRIGEYGQ